MKPLLARIEKGEIDPEMVITHRLPLVEGLRHLLEKGRQLRESRPESELTIEPHPSLLFASGDGSFCAARRQSSATPLAQHGT